MLDTKINSRWMYCLNVKDNALIFKRNLRRISKSLKQVILNYKYDKNELIESEIKKMQKYK